MTKLPGFSVPLLRWRYMRAGGVRHYVNVKNGQALCGLYPPHPPRQWFGNADKLEHDTVAAMTPCRDCVQAADALRVRR